MNLVSIGRPKMAWYEERKSVTFERQVLRSEVFLRAEGDRQAHATYGVCGLAGHDPVKGFIAGGHFGEVELHLA
jgi:hypothetical protein